jgi:coproporphyrinogen III oxidase
MPIFGTHINNARGLGGLFFDYCKATDTMSMQDWFNFVTELGIHFNRMFLLLKKLYLYD